VHGLHRTADVVDKAMRDLQYRTHGLLAETRALFRHEAVTDDILVQRVRSRMGRAVSHPHAVEVGAKGGQVTLRGLILAGEVKDLLSSVERVPGVSAVVNQLAVHTRDDAVPSLQGERRAGPPLAARWSPLTRVALGVLGGLLLASGLSRRNRAGVALASAGAALLVRDVADRPLRRVLGIGAGMCGVDVHKTLTVRAPIREVFGLFTEVESFPRFMAHVKEVRRTGEGRYHWVAAGPAGLPVSWDSEISELVPEKVLAWRSLPGPGVQNAGIARFEEGPDGGTRVDIQMSYNPPAGAVGHLLASLFGADPKHAMDQDFVRFQSLLEQGKTTANGEEVRRADLSSRSSRSW